MRDSETFWEENTWLQVINRKNISNQKVIHQMFCYKHINTQNVWKDVVDVDCQVMVLNQDKYSQGNIV